MWVGEWQPRFLWDDYCVSSIILPIMIFTKTYEACPNFMGDKNEAQKAYTTFIRSQISVLSNALAGAQYPVSSIQERGIKRTE